MFYLLLLTGLDQVAGALATIFLIQPVFSGLPLVIGAGRFFLSFRPVTTPHGGIKRNAFQLIPAKMLIDHHADRAGQQAKDQGDM